MGIIQASQALQVIEILWRRHDIFLHNTGDMLGPDGQQSFQCTAHGSPFTSVPPYRLVGIAELRIPFNGLFASVCFLVLPNKINTGRAHGDDAKRDGNETSVQSRAIPNVSMCGLSPGKSSLPVGWSVLVPEHQRSNDTTNTACSDNDGRAERALPLPENIVGLVGEAEGDV